MADARSNELLARLADLSEGAIQRLSDAPGADKVAGTLNSLLLAVLLGSAALETERSDALRRRAVARLGDRRRPSPAPRRP